MDKEIQQILSTCSVSTRAIAQTFYRKYSWEELATILQTERKAIKIKFPKT